MLNKRVIYSLYKILNSYIYKKENLPHERKKVENIISRVLVAVDQSYLDYHLVTETADVPILEEIQQHQSLNYHSPNPSYLVQTRSSLNTYQYLSHFFLQLVQLFLAISFWYKKHNKFHLAYEYTLAAATFANKLNLNLTHYVSPSPQYYQGVEVLSQQLIQFKANLALTSFLIELDQIHLAHQKIQSKY